MGASCRATLIVACALCAGCFDFGALQVTDAGDGDGPADAPPGDGPRTDGGGRRLRPRHVADPALLFAGEAPFPDLGPGDYEFNTDTGLLRACSVEYVFDQCTGATVAELPLLAQPQPKVGTEDIPAIAILAVSSMVLADGRGLRVVGSRPLVVLAAGEIRIDGILRAGGSRVQPGAGGGLGMGTVSDADPSGVHPGAACSGNIAAASLSRRQRDLGMGQCGESRYQGAAGGAGGSNGVPGGAGGRAIGWMDGSAIPDVLPAAAAGRVHTQRAADVFFGGGGGGGAGGIDLRWGPDTLENASTLRARGGHGGGAVQLTSNTRVSIGTNGILDANGGGGFGSRHFHPLSGDVFVVDGAGATTGGGAGGGAGGTVLLEAPLVEIRGGIYINGGGGSGGDATRIVVPADIGLCDPVTDFGLGPDDEDGLAGAHVTTPGGAGGQGQSGPDCAYIAGSPIPDAEEVWLAADGGAGASSTLAVGAAGAWQTLTVAGDATKRFGGGGGGGQGRLILVGDEVLRKDATISATLLTLTVDQPEYVGE